MRAGTIGDRTRGKEEAWHPRPFLPSLLENVAAIRQLSRQATVARQEICAGGLIAPQSWFRFKSILSPLHPAPTQSALPCRCLPAL
jgi:hypothetical protein